MTQDSHVSDQNAIQYEQVLGSATTDKRLDVLRAVTVSGSISEAARACGISYKAAWQAVETLSNLAGVALLEKSVGGAGGGGTRLTQAGQAVLQAADMLNEARQQALNKMRFNAQATGLNFLGVAGLGLRTSMRNHLPCTVMQIESGQSGARVNMQLGDGQALVSKITQESVQLLGLAQGMQVLAMCKATAVSIVPAQQRVAAGNEAASNVFTGVVARMPQDHNDCEVSLQLAPGVQLLGFASAQHLQAGIVLGGHAKAVLDEAAVVIGLLH